MDIKLGHLVKDKSSGFTGIVYCMDDHFHGCSTALILAEGCEEQEKGHFISTAVLEVIGVGISDKIEAIPDQEPKFKPGDWVTTLLGTKGVITIRTKTLQKTYRYFVDTPSEDNKKPTSIITFEALMMLHPDS